MRFFCFAGALNFFCAGVAASDGDLGWFVLLLVSGFLAILVSPDARPSKNDDVHAS